MVPKFGGLSVDGEAGKGDDQLRRWTGADGLGNGEIRGYGKRDGRFDLQRQRGSGFRVWVKKGEVADGNGGGV
ncbi:hypothetical protein ACFX1X_016939 [Malus domestica]